MPQDLTASTSPGESPLATLTLRDTSDIVTLCRRTRTFGEQAGLDSHAVQCLSTAAYEIACLLCVKRSPYPTVVLSRVGNSLLQVDFHAAIPSEIRTQVRQSVASLQFMVDRLSVDADELCVHLAMCRTGAGALPIATGVPRTDAPHHPEPAEAPRASRSAQQGLQDELRDTHRGVVDLCGELNACQRRLSEAESGLRGRAEELAAASRAKEEFLSTLSHELRTPLNAILGWTRLLRSGRLEPAMAERALETIERNARLQEQLIADLLDLSRVVTGQLRVNLRPIALPAIVEESLQAVRPAAEAKGVTLRTAVATQSRDVRGDPHRLQQVFWNLLVNAIKFTPSGGTVTLSLEYHADRATVMVSDTGEGIGHELLPFVFDRFRQGDTSVTRAYGGLGLGLAIVRHLVEAHGGRVSVESAGPGQGAAFAVTLPLPKLPELPTQPESSDWSKLR